MTTTLQSNAEQEVDRLNAIITDLRTKLQAARLTVTLVQKTGRVEELPGLKELRVEWQGARWHVALVLPDGNERQFPLTNLTGLFADPTTK